MQMAVDPANPNAAKTGQNRIRQSFARGLPSYHGAAIAQAQIASLLAQALVDAGAPQRFQQALEFGCGTGLLTDALLQRFAIDQLMLNDLVADPAATLQPILDRHKTQTTFYAGPVETLPLPTALDLVASASTVQWVADPAALIVKLALHIAPGGWLALSGFARDHFAELRAVGAAAQAPSYLDGADWRAILPANMTVHSVTHHRISLQFPNAVSLLRHLRQTGVNAQAGRHWTRADLARFEASLRATQPNDGPLTLTYCPVIVIAQNQF